MEKVKQEDESRSKLSSSEGGNRFITASGDDHLNEIFRKIKASKSPVSNSNSFIYCYITCDVRG